MQERESLCQVESGEVQVHVFVFRSVLSCFCPVGVMLLLHSSSVASAGNLYETPYSHGRACPARSADSSESMERRACDS
jgi:hypothetical protein